MDKSIYFNEIKIKTNVEKGRKVYHALLNSLPTSVVRLIWIKILRHWWYSWKIYLKEKLSLKKISKQQKLIKTSFGQIFFN